MVDKRRMPVLQRAEEELEEPLRGVGQPLLQAQRLEAVHPLLEPQTLGPVVDSVQAVAAACS